MTAPATAIRSDSPRPASKARRTRPWAAYWTIGLLSLFAFIPVAWMLVTAFTAEEGIFERTLLTDRPWTLENFSAVLTDPTLLRFIGNGLFVSITTAVVSLMIGFLAGYSFSKFRYRGRSIAMYTLLLAQMVPEVLLLLTLFSTMAALGVLDTYPALIVSYTTFTLPLSVLMMKNAFDSVPDELIEAGRVDGASEWRIMNSLVFPVVKTSMVAVCMFAFIRAWNDLVYALTLVDTAKQTLPAGLTMTYVGEFQVQYGEMMAASLLSSIPVIAIFLIFQKHFVSGALSGSIK
ncbi:carbohydrate ABC transporter permease [Gulosibacter sp. 10]|uniref:carbohydrate ABC transporter permease n=1 Tax=Gulosibacter sp. 10 TaxID=1255570 RepID=UPI00097F017F|nr:carbohydrate ABC transporter permease [Gulosibacter sp. 10]SJM56127.1 ABC transporter, permease protein [Gulosibacter sp. 10]